MKKRIMMLLFIFGIFVVGFSSVKADIDITCRGSSCGQFSFKLVQLTTANTGTSGSYKNYASYFENYYQSTPACGYMTKAAGCGNLTDLSSGFDFDGKYYANTGFDFYTNYGFYNISELIGTSASYQKAGTYVFLLKATATDSGVTLDKSEYIIYVNVKNNSTIGTTIATQIKDMNGSAVNNKVNELSYGYVGAYPSKPETIYNVEGDFYISNTFASGYADTSLQTAYYIKIPTSTSITAKIYNKNGFVKDVTLSPNSSYTHITISHGEVLVFPKGSLTTGSKVGVQFYAMYGDGLYDNTLNVYKPSVKKSENGVTTTLTSVQSAWNGNYDSSKANEVTIGGTGENYLEYTYTYDQNLVPSTGVVLETIIPYVLILVLSVITVVLVLAVLKRKKTETTK